MTGNTHPSDLELSTFLVGDLGERERRKVEQHLAACERCRREYDDMAAERERYDDAQERAQELAFLEAKQGAARVDIRPKTFSMPLKKVMIPAAAGIAAAVLGMILLRVPPDEPASVRVKGDDTLVMYVKRNAEVTTLTKTCHPGDSLRSRFMTSKRFVFIIGAEPSANDVYPLYPPGGVVSAPVQDRPTEPPGSWILDDALGTQLFVAFFSDRELRYEELETAVKTAFATGNAIVLSDASIATVSCQKTPSPKTPGQGKTPD